MKRIFKPALFIVLVALISHSNVFAQPQPWTKAKGLTGGTISAVAVIDSLVLASVENDGLYRSTDFGIHWSRVALDMKHILAIGGSDSIQFVAEADAGTYAHWLYASTDRGVTWHLDTRYASPPSMNFYLDHLYSQGRRHLTIGRGSAVMFTGDDGVHWDTIQFLVTYSSCGAIWNNQLFIGTTDSGIYRSTDEGKTWIDSDSGLVGAGSVLQIQGNSSSIYALKQSLRRTTYQNALLRSTDSGRTWRDIQHFQSNDGGATWRNLASIEDCRQVWVAGDTIVYASINGGLYVSTDNGAAFLRRTFDRGDVVRILAGTSATLLSGMWYGGLFVSRDFGGNWTQGIDSAEVPTVLSIAVTSSGKMFAAVAEEGIATSTDAGKSWHYVDTERADWRGRQPRYANDMIAHGDTLVLATSQGIWRSFDGGKSYDTTGMPHRWCNAIAGYGDAMVICGDSILFRSTDGGIVWYQAMSGLPTSLFVTGLHATKDGVFYCAISDSGTYRSIDSGKTWKKTGSNLWRLNRFASIGNVIVASGSGGNFNSGTDGLYRSIDGGVHWVLMPFLRTPSDWDSYYTLEAICASDNRFYFATYNSQSPTNPIEFYVSTDTGLTVRQCYGAFSGDTWIEKMLYVDSTLYFAADQLGVFYAKDDRFLEVGAEQNTMGAKSFSLDRNYPNPFNPQTMIRYTLGSSGMTTLTVCDILGRQVATLVNEVQTAGEHLVRFDGSAYASGVYFYKLAANGSVAVKKFLLAK